MKRKNASRGETLPETLVALLTAALTFLFLSGAVVAAARVNSSVKNEQVAFQTASLADKTSEQHFSVTIDGMGTAARLYRTTNGYYYYE